MRIPTEPEIIYLGFTKPDHQDKSDDDDDDGDVIVMEHTNGKSEERTCYRAEALRADFKKKIEIKETRHTHRRAVVKKKKARVRHPF